MAIQMTKNKQRIGRNRVFAFMLAALGMLVAVCIALNSVLYISASADYSYTWEITIEGKGEIKLSDPDSALISKQVETEVSRTELWASNINYDSQVLQVIVEPADGWQLVSANGFAGGVL
jgi:hypothetical protein